MNINYTYSDRSGTIFSHTEVLRKDHIHNHSIVLNLCDYNRIVTNNGQRFECRTEAISKLKRINLKDKATYALDYEKINSDDLNDKIFNILNAVREDIDNFIRSEAFYCTRHYRNVILYANVDELYSNSQIERTFYNEIRNLLINYLIKYSYDRGVKIILVAFKRDSTFIEHYEALKIRLIGSYGFLKYNACTPPKHMDENISIAKKLYDYVHPIDDRKHIYH